MQIIILILALSIDVLIASAACGTEHITIGNKTALCISGVCSGVLFLALTAGNLLDGILKEEYTKWFGFAGLLCVGLFKLAEYAVRTYIRRHKFLWKQVKFRFSQLNFILSIYNNPVMADRDKSSTMSVGEGFFFALAMSVDGFFGGLSAAFLAINIWLAVICNFLFGFLAVRVGSLAGRYISGKKDRDLSWIGGVLFLVLAFGKL
jgi:putative sporulation protein YtaF